MSAISAEKCDDENGGGELGIFLPGAIVRVVIKYANEKQIIKCHAQGQNNNIRIKPCNAQNCREANFYLSRRSSWNGQTRRQQTS